MKSEIKKYQKFLEMQEQKSEYEKFRGLFGEKRLFHKPEEFDEFCEMEENQK